MVVPLLIAAGIGYVLGALPFGYLVARAHGVNIFEVGSRNPGATNVRRTLGARAGNLVFVLDALKGALAAGWALLGSTGCRFEAASGPLAGHVLEGGDWTRLAVAGLVGALLGHSFSCFTRFRGGKGVATAAGGFLVLMPLATLIAAAVWVLTFLLSRYVSLASILSALALPIAAWALGRSPLVLGIASLVGVFVIIRHRANLVRLANGTEARFERRRSPSTSS